MMPPPPGSLSSRSREIVEPHVGGSPPNQAPPPFTSHSYPSEVVVPSLLSPPRSPVSDSVMSLVQLTPESSSRAPESCSADTAILDSDSHNFVNPGSWEYFAVLPGTSSVLGVGHTDETPAPFHRASVVLHKRRTARIPSTIPERNEFLGQLSVETTQWKLGINNPYLALRDDVDHTDAILEELHAVRVEHSKRDIVKTEIPPALKRKKLYSKVRKPRYIPHFGVNTRQMYEPQFGNSVSEAMSCVKQFVGQQKLSLPNNLLSRVEDLVLLFLQVKDVQSTTQLAAILIAYYKTLVSGSVLRSVESFVYALFESGYTAQAGSNSDPDWLTYLREGKTTWNILMGCPAFEKVSKLLSLCVTLGMCNASSLSFSIGSFKLFSIEAQKKHVTSLDLLDAFANTVFYFVEGGYRVFTTGSLKPLIYTDFEAKQFDDDSCECERLSEFSKTGDLQRLGLTTTSRFDKLLTDTIDKGHQLMNMTHTIAEKTIFRLRLDKLRRIQTDLIQRRLSGGLREAPFVVSFYGGSAQGKSSIAKIFMSALLEANGCSSSPEFTCSINENDKFMSNYLSCVQGVYVDDVANSKADYVDRPPSQILIDLNNNVPTYALQAEAEKKGKVVVEPKIVICTTNVKDLGATVYSNEPVSIARRAHLHVTTKVKDEFLTNGMLDSQKVWLKFPDPNIPIQDIWDLTIETVEAVKSVARNGVDSIGWKVVNYKSKPMSNVSVEDALRCAVEQSRMHFVNQQRVVEQANTLQDRLDVCATCGMPSMFCLCPKCGPVYPMMRPLDDKCKCGKCVECIAYSEPETYCTVCDKIIPTQIMAMSKFYNYHMAAYHYCHCLHLQRHPEEIVFTPDTLPPPLPVLPYVKPVQPYDPQFGEMIANVVFSYGTRWIFSATNVAERTGARLEEYATANLYQIANKLERSWVVRWTNWIPQQWLLDKRCEDIVCFMERDSILQYAYSQLSTAAFLSLFTISVALWNSRMPMLLPWLVLLLFFSRNCRARYILAPVCWLSAGAPLVLPTLFFSTTATSIAVFSMCHKPWMIHYHPDVFLILLLYPILTHLLNGLCCRKRVYAEIMKRNNAIPVLVAQVRDNHMQYLLTGCVSVGVLFTLCKVWSLLRVVPESQGKLEPTDMSDVEHRDAEVNPWSVPVVKPLPCTLKSKSVTHKVLCDLVFNNLAHMSCDIDGKTSSCDAFFPFSNVAIIPQHAWKKPELEMHFVRKDPSIVGANFSCFLSQSQSVPIPNTDFCVVWVPNGGDWKDLRPYFPLDRLTHAYATLVHKDKNGNRVEGVTNAIYGVKSTLACENFFGASYVLPFKTFRGLCMAPLVSQTNGPMIVGFHVGGVENSGQGCAGFLTIQELDSALAALANMPGVLLAKSSGTIEKVLYDVQWFESSNIHPKSPLNFLPPGTNCELYGSCLGRAKYFSEVVSLPISETVTEIMGVPKLWGKPKFSTKSWRESLLYSTMPSAGVEPSLLEHAVLDYENQLDEILLSPKWKKLIDTTRPLRQMEVVCGIDGKRFIDKMPPNTSVGFPLSGAKSQYLELLPPEDFPEFNCPAMLDNRFWEEWMECERRYCDGNRSYPVFKACLKDEPTKLDKDKVRVFQAAPIALQLGIRKYFLPLARILSLFPLRSECAVGINAQSPEWHEVMSHVGRFGENTLAGDYSKYDLRMPAQLTLAAFRVLMHIAQRCGYSEYDLIIMSGIATDVCYPLMAYNGDLIQHYGSNPSGQNLTVYVNCIVNSLLFRCGAIKILGSRYTRFSDICSLITYGDDADSTVNPLYPEFNHLSYAKFLEERGMVFTMPDKGSVPTAYMSRSESHFLKRESKLLADTGILCGALEEHSIFKSLHCVLRSKAVTTTEQSVNNICGASREFFFHGPETYELRRRQLIAVAEKHNLLPLCPDLALTFADRLTAWKEQYIPDPKCL